MGTKWRRGWMRVVFELAQMRNYFSSLTRTQIKKILHYTTNYTDFWDAMSTAPIFVEAGMSEWYCVCAPICSLVWALYAFQRDLGFSDVCPYMWLNSHENHFLANNKWWGWAELQFPRGKNQSNKQTNKIDRFIQPSFGKRQNFNGHLFLCFYYFFVILIVFKSCYTTLSW